MARIASTFALILPPRDPGLPAYRWLYSAVRSLILDGRLHPGARIPGTRDLARQYGMSRGTIVNAFDQLKSEGYVEGTIGSGTYVSKVLPDEFFRLAGAEGGDQPARVRPRRIVSGYGARVALFPALETGPARAFRANMPALDLFPAHLWAQLSSRRWRRVSSGLLTGCGSMGYRPLREAVADYLRTSRGVRCVADQIAIVSGVQEALDLVARIVLDPGDRVCMEDPGYTGAALAFSAVGAKISPSGADHEGMKLQPGRLRGSRLVYVTPAHQFPLGVTMSLRRRLELLEWARDSGALIFEDDYDSEFRYSGRPIPALQGIDGAGVVIFAGSFSKVLFPSLRLGYIVLPEDLVQYVAAAKSVTSRHAQLLDQAVLCDFMTGGHFGRHLRRMRQRYAERLQALLEGAEQHLRGLLEVSTVEAGLQTVGWLADGIAGESAVRAAAGRGVIVNSLHQYSRGKVAREGLQLGFAAVDEREIRRGVRDLAIALAGELRSRR